MTASRRPPRIPDRVFIIGIAGRHMSAIARVLQAWGCEVRGSDQRSTSMTDALIAEGIDVRIGHDAAHVGDAQLVAYSSAVKPGHVELAEAERRGIEAIKRHELVARMMEGFFSVAVAGTHGKTTTSGLMAHILVECGLDPTYLIGGIVRSLGTNAAVGSGRYFVVEADEYDYAFLAYRPDVAIVTNIEPDHLDLFGSVERMNASFGQFMSQVKPDGRLYTCADSGGLREVAGTSVIGASHEWYALDSEADWRARDVAVDGERQQFAVTHGGEAFGAYTTALPGRHNVSNALAGIAASAGMGLDMAAVREAVASFRGAVRRFEPVGEEAGVTLMDDYAHHPTEVRATIQSARQRFGRRRLVFLFQPNTFSRNQYLFEEWKTTFEDVDVLYLAPTYGMGRETPEHGLTSDALGQAIVGAGAVHVCSTFEEAVDRVGAELREGDVFFTVGSGDIDRAGPLVLQKLRERAG